MGSSISQMNAQALERQEELARLKEQLPPGVNISVPFKGSWIGTVIGVAIACPVGIKRKSLIPLVYYGAVGTMIDVVFSVNDYEQQYETRLREYVAKLNKDKQSSQEQEQEQFPQEQQFQQPDIAQVLRD